MIDTIRVQTSVPIGTKVNPELWTRSINNHGGSRIDIHHVRNDGINFKLIGEEFEEPKLTAEVSLPKLLYGHNIGILTNEELQSALDILGDKIHQQSVSASLPALGSWDVVRLDFGYSWRVEEPNAVINDIAPYVNSRVTAGTFVHRNHATDGATVTVHQESFDRKFYNKEAEVESKRKKWGEGTQKERAELSEQHSKNVLRFESTNRNDRIKRTLMPDGRTVLDLRSYIDEKLLSHVQADVSDLTKGWKPSKPSEVIRLIVATYGETKKSRGLIKFWATVQQFGKAKYLKIAPNKDEFNSNLRELRVAGVGFGKLPKGTLSLDVPSSSVVFCHDLVLPRIGEEWDQFEARTGIPRSSFGI